MLDETAHDKLKNLLIILETNIQRLDFAHSRMKRFLPFDKSIIDHLEEEQISFMDQYIFRFSKIQDIMGNKLFQTILELVEEDTESLAFIDVLNKLEKLGVIDDKSEWLHLRKLRNEVSHEYPLVDSHSHTALNELFNSKNKLVGYFRACKKYLIGRNII